MKKGELFIESSILNVFYSGTGSSSLELRWEAGGVTVAGLLGIPGTGSNQLQNPWGLIITHDYSLYITDRFNHRIQKYPRDSSAGMTIAGSSNGTSGSGNSTLFYPSVSLLDRDGNLYIADTLNHRVQFWRSGASSGTTIAGFGEIFSSLTESEVNKTPCRDILGGIGSGTNQLNFPYGITKDWIKDTLYIADFSNARIIAYTSGATSGTVVCGGNGHGNNPNQLNYPVAVHFDPLSNSLLVLNLQDHNLVRWKVGETNWTLVAGSAQGTAGNSTTLLRLPVGFIIDPMGNIYVADSSNHRIQFFPAGQTTAITIAGMTGVAGNSSSLLNRPFAVALDNQLNLYVSDSNNHRVQKFARY